MSEKVASFAVADAARMLGVSVDTVRRRLKRGELRGERDARGKWWVELVVEDEDEAEAAPLAAEPEAAEPEVDEAESAEPEAAEATADEAEVDEATADEAEARELIIDQLSDEVEALREELAAVARERDELRAELDSQSQQVGARPVAISIELAAEIDRRVEQRMLEVMAAKLESERERRAAPGGGLGQALARLFKRR